MTFDVHRAGHEVINETIGTTATMVYLPDVPPAERATVLRRAAVILAQHTAKDLTPDEIPLIRDVKLLQFVTAGVDFIPLRAFPEALPIASNGGAFAEPMAEHALAMTLAAAKRLFIEHHHLAHGAFHQFVPNRMLGGRVCGIFGFGGVGVATARLMRAMGMTIHAINRRGSSAAPTEWIGTPAHLDVLLRVADVFVIAAPLSPATVGCIGARELSLMKEDAILVNLARGEIIDEGAMFAHLQGHPTFTACLDAWWVEPIRHGVFRMHYPFMELPNVIGSPHNSASVGGGHQVALQRAAENCRRALTGAQPTCLIGPEERLV